jgi:hypothetical protein
MSARRPIAGEAVARGIGVVITSILETAVGVAGALHLAAGVDSSARAATGGDARGEPSTTHPIDLAHGLATLDLFAEQPVTGLFMPTGGRLALPVGAGLGVRLPEDWAAEKSGRDSAMTDRSKASCSSRTLRASEAQMEALVRSGPAVDHPGSEKETSSPSRMELSIVLPPTRSRAIGAVLMPVNASDTGQIAEQPRCRGGGAGARGGSRRPICRSSCCPMRIPRRSSGRRLDPRCARCGAAIHPPLHLGNHRAAEGTVLTCANHRLRAACASALRWVRTIVGLYIPLSSTQAD